MLLRVSAPLVTIVTVCRNVLPALRRTAESVLAEQRPDVEYWVVDGASTDGTREFLPELEHRGVRTLSEPDRGIADAMNKGSRLATGTWVQHLHADDELLPGALEIIAREARDDADVLCGWLEKREVRGETLFRCDPSRLDAEMTVNHPATFVRRELFERFGGFDTRWPNAMDYEFFLRLKVHGARFRVIDAPLARMAYGGQSERSLRRTLAEARDIRRLHRSPALYRSQAWYLYQLIRSELRGTLQRAGLGSIVGWYRRRFSWPPKGRV
jgi:glycosyltransferase involved in cell wall biosynthesis